MHIKLQVPTHKYYSETQVEEQVVVHIKLQVPTHKYIVKQTDETLFAGLIIHQQPSLACVLLLLLSIFHGFRERS